MNKQEGLGSIIRKNNNKNQLKSAYIRLNEFIENVNHKISGRIQMVTQVYMKDYEAQMTLMTEELKNIRSVLDQELLRQRANQRLFFLEEERDFFRGQVVKINEEVTKLTHDNNRLKEELEESKSEAINYKSLVVALQKKILKIQNQAFQADKLRETKPQSIAPPPLLDQKQTFTTLTSRPTLIKFQPEIQRNAFRSVELKREKSSPEFDNEVRKKGEILDLCIKDIKKKIFYRTLTDDSSSKKYFDEHRKVPFQKFTRTDKEDLIRSILQSPGLLEQFYTFMTTSKKEKEDSPSKIPTGVKTSLNDKIFKIKLRGLSGSFK